MFICLCQNSGLPPARPVPSSRTPGPNFRTEEGNLVPSLVFLLKKNCKLDQNSPSSQHKRVLLVWPFAVLREKRELSTLAKWQMDKMLHISYFANQAVSTILKTFSLIFYSWDNKMTHARLSWQTFDLSNQWPLVDSRWTVDRWNMISEISICRVSTLY